MQVVEVSPTLENIPERTPPRLGTLIHLKGVKSLIHKYGIVVLIFQGTKRKAHKNICLMLAAGIEPAKPQQAKKGADCTPLIKLLIVKFIK